MTIKHTAAFDFLAVSEEKAEVDIVLKHRTVKLQYNGVQKFPGQPDLKLWTILNDCFHKGMNFRYSTRSLEGLRELGVL